MEEGVSYKWEDGRLLTIIGICKNEENTMYKIAICDDERYMVEEIEKELRKVLNKLNENNYEVDTYGDGNQLLMAKKSYHVYILDIEMPELSGLVLAKKIRENNPQGVIIFLTGYKGYMKASFKVEPLDYLVKPIDEEEFEETIKKSIEKVTPATIEVKS